ncbi:DNA-3-methyladenine glycosylase 2 family protein [Vineibacter terrae]|uniref:DNA-3-methyladenine glycosylase family protein n=1 Tax=Vineibacter terrae TaxID=2586908 RepID=UPI002E351F5A|nr:DNA-3-methyladenine glycosylase 2 family protein [Vineibacter terrae]HEX2889141.1 DNA-3-methyladenine glycosylase 2 family protein [Vineibacter terrae]
MSIPFRLDEARLREGMDYLAQLDPRFAEARATYGDPPLRTAEEGFSALLRSIIGQQVSVFAARSIWDRVATAVDPVTPQNVLRLSDEELRACGLSNNKVKFARALALDTVEGRIIFADLPALDDESLVSTLTQAKGIGRWTAEIYMMFALGRPDVMPANDLGLLVAAQHLLKLRQRPEPERLLKLSKPWRPWRTVAALFLWHFRRNMPDFSSSPAAQARREAERLAREERKAARLAKAAAQPAPPAAAARKAAAKKRTVAASRRKQLKRAAPKARDGTPRKTT